MSIVQPNKSSSLSLDMKTDIIDFLGIELEPSSLLLQVLQSCMLTTKAQQAAVTKDLWKINSSVESLELVKLEQPRVVTNLSKECRCSETELQTI
jgi:hypothetical protein